MDPAAESKNCRTKPAPLANRPERATVATLSSDGVPHVLPIGFAVDSGEVVTAVDQKSKKGKKLARVRNIEADPRVTVMIDRWSEDWDELGWVMIRGIARLESPGTANDALVARYEQYRERPPEGPAIVVRPESILWWTSR